MWRLVLCVCLLMGVRGAEAAPKKPAPSEQQSLLQQSGRAVQFKLSASGGLIAPLANEIQLGGDATRLDYIKDGGQRTIFFYLRLGADIRLFGHHLLALAYQPFDLRTRQKTSQAIRVSGTDFEAGTAIDYRFQFSFWRLTYAYDFFRGSETELAIGISFQLRNPIFEFVAVNGSASHIGQDVSPVVLLTLRGRLPIGARFFLGADLSAIYIPFFGDTGTFSASLADCQLRIGYELRRGASLFLAARYIGGYAEVRDVNLPQNQDSSYGYSQIHTLALSLGASVW